MDEKIRIAGGGDVIEFLLESKKAGKIWDLSKNAQSVSWDTNRTGSPGKLTTTLTQIESITVNNGDVLRLSEDGKLQFYGYIFTISRNRWGEVDITAYDRLRYLKANASYAFYNMSPEAIISQIAGDLQVPVSTLDPTGYILPSLVESDQSCLDMISDVVQKALLGTGKVYVFFDDGNGLSLREAGNMITDVVLGDKSLVTEYTATEDIDSQTYNSIKLARPNEETGGADVVIVQDSQNIGQWGFLQLYQTVDSALNTAQMTAQAQATLEYYNRELKSLKISALGVPSLRAGQMILANIERINLKQYLLLDKVSHTWESDIHTMEIEAILI